MKRINNKYTKVALHGRQILRSGAVVVRDVTTKHRKKKNLWR